LPPPGWAEDAEHDTFLMSRYLVPEGQRQVAQGFSAP
jgi:hypothetical protein